MYIFDVKRIKSQANISDFIVYLCTRSYYFYILDGFSILNSFYTRASFRTCCFVADYLLLFIAYWASMAAVNLGLAPLLPLLAVVGGPAVSTSLTAAALPLLAFVVTSLTVSSLMRSASSAA